jgi:hypothetical protein
MKFLFIDEFKYDYTKDSTKLYGLVGVLIDAVHYPSFKKTFHDELNSIGWNKHLELKGKSMFSSDGDKNVVVEDRINFMSKVVSLSKSASSGKNTKIHAYVSIELYSKEEKEFNCYVANLKKIILKFQNNKDKKKGLLAVFYDENSCINHTGLTNEISSCLTARGYSLFESPFAVRSNLENPGIMFADYVCYFHQSFLQLKKFRRENGEEIATLLKKDDLTESEKGKLKSHVINFKKESTSKDLIASLKKVIYV